MSDDWTPSDLVGGDNDDDDDVAEVFYDKIVHVTDAAALLKIDDAEVWIPKSRIYEAIDGMITMAEWLAVEKDLL